MEDSIVMVKGKNIETKVDYDKGFINDKYWLLVPFQLVWDTSATISEPKNVQSPINKEQLDMITILM